VYRWFALSSYSWASVLSDLTLASKRTDTLEWPTPLVECRGRASMFVRRRTWPAMPAFAIVTR